MASTSNLSSLLRSYATKQGSAFVNFRDFCDYMKKYAEKNVETNAELIKYLGNPEKIIRSELQELASQHLVHVIDQGGAKTVIIVISFFSIQFAGKYKELIHNSSVPFPLMSDLPKQVPLDAIERKSAQDFLPTLAHKQDLKSPNLYCLMLPHDVPAILFPACVPVHILTDAALEKIRIMLKKEEYRDYFLKKLRNANPGKELSTKTFFDQFTTRLESAIQSMESQGDSFYFWNQLCYFIRQDFQKIKDSTTEDVNLLQSVAIAEMHLLSLKKKVQQKQQKENALKSLELSLQKPPYFYSMQSILKFTDSKGIPLHGRYSDEDLKKFLEMLTTKTENSELPNLLVFKVASGTRYFIYKTKVFPLIIRLCNEAHDNVMNNLTAEWHNALQNYKHLPEMSDKQRFESVLEDQVIKYSPVLYALLTANFLALLNIELYNSTESEIFKDGRVRPYSELLILNSNDILSNAKVTLPLWHSIPLLSKIIGFFAKLRKNKVNTDKVPGLIQQEDQSTKKRTLSKREALADTARTLSSHFVPEGSTIDRELDAYCKQWNKLITKEAHAQLTEDVNALIRDYMRKVINTISAQTFTADRIETLANALCRTPNMQKITEHEALFMYVQLYILRLVSNG